MLEKKIETAVHEGGHAIVAVLHNLQVEEVSIYGRISIIYHTPEESTLQNSASEEVDEEKTFANVLMDYIIYTEGAYRDNDKVEEILAPFWQSKEYKKKFLEWLERCKEIPKNQDNLGALSSMQSLERELTFDGLLRTRGEYKPKPIIKSVDYNVFALDLGFERRNLIDVYLAGWAATEALGYSIFPEGIDKDIGDICDLLEVPQYRNGVTTLISKGPLGYYGNRGSNEEKFAWELTRRKDFVKKRYFGGWFAKRKLKKLAKKLMKEERLSPFLIKNFLNI